VKRLCVVLVSLAVVTGVVLRLAWCEQRNAASSRRVSWRSLVLWEPANEKFPFLHDEYLYYVSTAVNAFKGDGFFPDYNRARDGVYVPPPLQSLFTLAVYRLHGRVVSPPVLQRWQVALAAVMILVSAEIGRRCAGNVAAVLAAWLVAVSPHFVYWTAFLQTEANYLFGVALVMLLLLRWWQRPEAVRAASAALALGLLNLQRVNGLLLGPVFAVAALVRGGRRGAASAATFLLLPLLVLLPWFVRNLLVYGEPILVNSNAGVHLHMSNNLQLDAGATPYLDAAITNKDVVFPHEIESWYRNSLGRLRRKFTYYDYSQRYQRVFLAYVREHPLHFLRNYAIKFWNQLALVQDAPRQSVRLFGSWLFLVYDRVLLLGGLLGLGLGLLRRRGEIVALALGFGLQLAVGALGILERDGRYNAHLKLYLVWFLAYAVAEVLRSRREQLTQHGVQDPAVPEVRDLDR